MTLIPRIGPDHLLPLSIYIIEIIEKVKDLFQNNFLDSFTTQIETLKFYNKYSLIILPDDQALCSTNRICTTKKKQIEL